MPLLHFLSLRWRCPGGSTPGHPWPHSRPGGRGSGNNPCGNAGYDLSRCPQSDVHKDLVSFSIRIHTLYTKYSCQQQRSSSLDAGSGCKRFLCWRSSWDSYFLGHTAQFWWIMICCPINMNWNITWRRVASYVGGLGCFQKAQRANYQGTKPFENPKFQ